MPARGNQAEGADGQAGRQPPRVELLIGDAAYAGWTAVRITRGLERAVADFEIELTEKWPGRDRPWVIPPGAACQLLADGDPVITGWVDTYAPEYDAGEHKVKVKGRSKTCDLADCAAIAPGGQFTGVDLAQLARALAEPFGIEVRVACDVGAPLREVQIQQGETAWETIERAARLRSVLLTDAPDGALVLTRAGQARVSGALVRGKTILAAEGMLSHAQRYSDYVVKAQQSGAGDAVEGLAASEVEGRVRDPAVTRYRPRVVVAEGQADPATALERARWDMLRRAGKSVQATITVAGWRQPDGRLWAINELVPVADPWLGIDRDLLIGEVRFSLAEKKGTLCELTLAPPEAYTPEPPREEDNGGGSAGGGEGEGGGGLWADVRPIDG